MPLAEPWVAFLTALDGSFGTFLMGDPHGVTPRGSASSAPGTPLVAGGSQTGQTLAIDGAPNNATGYLKEGDWISLSSGTSTRLYKVVEDANTNGSGEVTLSIWTSLRTSPGNNDVVTVSDAKGTFRMLGDTPYRIGRSHLYEFTFTAIEAI